MLPQWLSIQPHLGYLNLYRVKIAAHCVCYSTTCHLNHCMQYSVFTTRCKLADLLGDAELFRKELTTLSHRHVDAANAVQHGWVTQLEAVNKQ